jgi:CheY-like chemotaxis protein
MTKKRILFIDDNEVDNFIHRRLVQLSALEAEIHFCTQGLMGLQFLRKTWGDNKPVDIIFLDIDMPLMNGLEFLEEYLTFPQRFRKGVKLFVLTSSSFPIDYDVPRVLGFNEFLKKPLQQNILTRILDECNSIPA